MSICSVHFHAFPGAGDRAVRTPVLVILPVILVGIVESHESGFFLGHEIWLNDCDLSCASGVGVYSYAYCRGSLADSNEGTIIYDIKVFVKSDPQHAAVIMIPVNVFENRFFRLHLDGETHGVSLVNRDLGRLDCHGLDDGVKHFNVVSRRYFPDCRGDGDGAQTDRGDLSILIDSRDGLVAGCQGRSFYGVGRGFLDAQLESLADVHAMICLNEFD